MRVLFIGDVFGSIGKRVLAERLQGLREENRIDLCIANGENAAGGRGLTYNIYKKLRKYGVDVVTGGNHSFSIPDKLFKVMDEPYVLRPHNYPPGNIGKGTLLYELSDKRIIGIINLQGRTFLHASLDCPFRKAAEVVEEMSKKTKIIIIDFHAETTSEKGALAAFLDGKVSAVIGTHTHVQTADERILKGGTAFITDVGMTGPEDSIIGMKQEGVINRFLLQTQVPFEPSHSGPMLNGVIIEIDDSSGKSISIKRIYERLSFTNG